MDPRLEGLVRRVGELEEINCKLAESVAKLIKIVESHDVVVQSVARFMVKYGTKQ